MMFEEAVYKSLTNLETYLVSIERISTLSRTKFSDLNDSFFIDEIIINSCESTTRNINTFIYCIKNGYIDIAITLIRRQRDLNMLITLPIIKSSIPDIDKVKLLLSTKLKITKEGTIYSFWKKSLIKDSNCDFSEIQNYLSKFTHSNFSISQNIISVRDNHGHAEHIYLRFGLAESKINEVLKHCRYSLEHVKDIKSKIYELFYKDINLFITMIEITTLILKDYYLAYEKS